MQHWLGSAMRVGAAAAFILVTACTVLPVLAQSVTRPAPKSLEEPKALALPPPMPTVSRQLTGTGFFVDDDGHLLTAAHVIQGCVRVLVGKEDNRTLAKVIALSTHRDLALLKVPKTMGIAAVFPRQNAAATSDMVFASAYDQLAGLKIGGGVIANSRVTGYGESGALAIDAPVTFGASGAPVLDRLGLVQGVVSRRTSINRVLAVSATDAKAFLIANGVHIDQDDRPQIAGSASRAHRAASLSARVVCQQN